MLTLRAGRERCDLGGPGLGPLMLLLQLSCRMQLCPYQGGAANQLSVPQMGFSCCPCLELGALLWRLDEVQGLERCALPS